MSFFSSVTLIIQEVLLPSKMWVMEHKDAEERRRGKEEMKVRERRVCEHRGGRSEAFRCKHVLIPGALGSCSSCPCSTASFDPTALCCNLKSCFSFG